MSGCVKNYDIAARVRACDNHPRRQTSGAIVTVGASQPSEAGFVRGRSDDAPHEVSRLP